MMQYLLKCNTFNILSYSYVLGHIRKCNEFLLERSLQFNSNFRSYNKFAQRSRDH